MDKWLTAKSVSSLSLLLTSETVSLMGHGTVLFCLAELCQVLSLSTRILSPAGRHQLFLSPQPLPMSGTQAVGLCCSLCPFWPPELHICVPSRL